MKTQNAVWKKVVKMSLVSTFAISPIIMSASIAQAAPPNRAPAYGYRAKDNNRKDYQTFTGRVTNVKGQQFDLRVGNTTYNVYASSRLPNGLKQGDNVRVYGERYGKNDIRNANVSIVGNNNRGNWNDNRWDNHHRNDRGNHWNNYQTFTGVVTDVKSNSQFEIRSGNQKYDVYLSGNASRRLSKGDTVRVYGQRYGNDDIRNANVTVVRSSNNGQWNNNWNNNRYQTFTGVVTDVKSNSQFEIRSGNQKYDVYLSGNTSRRLSKGDTVRVYGQRYGNDDIRNANVTVVRSSNNGPWNNNSSSNSNGYQTFTGVVTNVKSNSNFDIRIGNDTYNVYPSGRIPSGLSKNDTVRVYGQRYGNNDIRNANIVILRKR